MFNAMYPVFILQTFMVWDIPNPLQYQLKGIIIKNKIVQMKKDLNLLIKQFILNLKLNQLKKKKH